MILQVHPYPQSGLPPLEPSLTFVNGDHTTRTGTTGMTIVSGAPQFRAGGSLAFSNTPGVYFYEEISFSTEQQEAIALGDIQLNGFADMASFSSDTDNGALLITFLDASNAVCGHHFVQDFTDFPSAITTYSFDAFVPANAAKVRYEWIGSRDTGTELSCYLYSYGGSLSRHPTRKAEYLFANATDMGRVDVILLGAPVGITTFGLCDYPGITGGPNSVETQFYSDRSLSAEAKAGAAAGNATLRMTGYLFSENNTDRSRFVVTQRDAANAQLSAHATDTVPVQHTTRGDVYGLTATANVNLDRVRYFVDMDRSDGTYLDAVCGFQSIMIEYDKP